MEGTCVGTRQPGEEVKVASNSHQGGMGSAAKAPGGTLCLLRLPPGSAGAPPPPRPCRRRSPHLLLGQHEGVFRGRPGQHRGLCELHKPDQVADEQQGHGKVGAHVELAGLPLASQAVPAGGGQRVSANV